MDDGFGHWLAGFIDGEGCFFISLRQRKDRNREVRLSLTIALRADDEPILREIHARTGIGRVHRREARRSSKQCYVWIVEAREDRFALIELLDRYPLRAKKAHDYRVWKAAVMAHQALDLRPGNPGAREPADFTEFERLAGEMRETRRFEGALSDG